MSPPKLHPLAAPRARPRATLSGCSQRPRGYLTLPSGPAATRTVQVPRPHPLPGVSERCFFAPSILNPLSSPAARSARRSLPRRIPPASLSPFQNFLPLLFPSALTPPSASRPTRLCTAHPRPSFARQSLFPGLASVHFLWPRPSLIPTSGSPHRFSHDTHGTSNDQQQRRPPTRHAVNLRASV